MEIEDKIHYILTQGYIDISVFQDWEMDIFYLSEAECEFSIGGVGSYFENSTRLHADQLKLALIKYGENEIAVCIENIQNILNGKEEIPEESEDELSIYYDKMEKYLDDSQLGQLITRIYNDNGYFNS